MPYYTMAGDYYRGRAGDYYRGDIFSSLGGLAKSVAGPVLTAVGTAFGGPIGGLIGGTVGGMLGGATPSAATSPPLTASAMALPSLPAIGTAAGRAAGAVVRAAKSPTGRAIATGVGTTLIFDALGNVVGGGGGKRRRSINVTNVHALRRALRRVDGFKHLAKKVGACPTHHRRAPTTCCKK